MRGGTGLAFVLLLLVPAVAGAQEPEGKLPAINPSAAQPLQTRIQEQFVPLAARLAQPVGQPVVFSQGSMQVQCDGRTCKGTAPDGSSPIQVCRDLKERLGQVESFAHGSQSLSLKELEACNSKNLPAIHPLPPQARPPEVTPRPEGAIDGDKAAPKPSDAGPQPEPTIGQPTGQDLVEAGPGAGPHLKPGEPRPEIPVGGADFRPPAGAPLPGPSDSPQDGAAGVEEMNRRRGAQDAAEAVREGMARRGSAPQITGFDAYPCLPASDDTLWVEGRRFGATAGSRRVVIGPEGRRFEARWTPGVLSWTDTRIAVLLPAALPAGRWAVAIADGSGEPLSDLRSFRRCPSAFPVSGRITINACAATLGNVAVRLDRETAGEGPASVDLPVGPDPFNDLAFRFEGLLSPGVYEATPRLTGGLCPGGSWSPGSYSIHISEFDGSPGAPRTDYDFTYTNVPLTTTRIPAVILTSLIEDLFDDTEMRLNNAGPESPRGSWYKPDDSWIRLSEDLGGEELPLDVPAGRGGAFQYYVNDVNLSDVRVTREVDAVAIRLFFESAGVELKGYCWGTRSMIDLDCPVGPDDSAPDIQIDNLSVKILLPPARFVPDRGPVGISYGDPRVLATAAVQARGVCEVVDVCSLLIDYERLILTGIEEGLESLLRQRWIKAVVAEGLGAATADPPLGPIGDVNSVWFEGTDLVIRHRPR